MDLNAGDGFELRKEPEIEQELELDEESELESELETTEEAEESSHVAWHGKHPWLDEAPARAAHIQEMIDEAEAKLKAQAQGPPILKIPVAKVSQGTFVNHRKALEEDARVDFLLRMQKTMNDTVDNAAWLHPHGLPDFDQCVIPECRLDGLEKFKMNIRRQNYIYLNHHPEVDALMSVFMKKLLKAQPKDAVKFATEFFSMRRMAPEDLQRVVKEELLKLKHFYTPKGWKQTQSSIGDHEVNNDIELKDVNEVKTLALGPTAQKFEFTPPPTPPKTRPKKIKEKKVKPKPHVYCGCKDPGRRKPVETEIKNDPTSNPNPPQLEKCYGLPAHGTQKREN